VVDSCHAGTETFAAVREAFSPREVVELLLLISYFRMISSVMTTLEVEVEPPFGAKILESVQHTAKAELTHGWR
jgi:hypothetical protein